MIAVVVTVVGGGVGVGVGLVRGVGVGAGSPVTVIAVVVMVVGGVGLATTMGGRTRALGRANGSTATARAPDPSAAASAARDSMVGMATFSNRINISNVTALRLVPCYAAGRPPWLWADTARPPGLDRTCPRRYNTCLCPSVDNAIQGTSTAILWTAVPISGT